MAKPLFIVCSETGAIDRHTNQLSITNIIEEINLVDVRGLKNLPPGIFIERQVMRVTSVWMRDEEDIGVDFESETTILNPGEEQATKIASGTFQFSKPRHRFVATMSGRVVANEGTLIVTNRIRRKGTDTWLSQEYPIAVTKVPLLVSEECSNQQQKNDAQ